MATVIEIRHADVDRRCLRKRWRSLRPSAVSQRSSLVPWIPPRDRSPRSFPKYAVGFTSSCSACPLKFGSCVLATSFSPRDRHRDLRDTGIRVKVRGGLAIVLACRQVYHEASGIFYSQKTFRHARSSDAPTASGTILVCAGWLEMLSARLSQIQGGYDMVLLST
jgi:hypothetical protein